MSVVGRGADHKDMSNTGDGELTSRQCPNCGYCPHCGRSNQPQFVPYRTGYPYWYVDYSNPQVTFTKDASASPSGGVLVARDVAPY